MANFGTFFNNRIKCYRMEDIMSATHSAKEFPPLGGSTRGSVTVVEKSSALDGDSSNSGSGEQRRYFEEKEKQSRQTEKQEVNPSRSRIDSDLEEQNDSKVSKSKVNEEGAHQDENYEAVDDIDLRETDHLEVEDAESDMSPPNSQSPKTKGKLKVGKKNPRAPKGHDKSPVKRKKDKTARNRGNLSEDDKSISKSKSRSDLKEKDVSEGQLYEETGLQKARTQFEVNNEPVSNQGGQYEIAPIANMEKDADDKNSKTVKSSNKSPKLNEKKQG